MEKPVMTLENMEVEFPEALEGVAPNAVIDFPPPEGCCSRLELWYYEGWTYVLGTVGDNPEPWRFEGTWSAEACRDEFLESMARALE